MGMVEKEDGFISNKQNNNTLYHSKHFILENYLLDFDIGFVY